MLGFSIIILFCISADDDGYCEIDEIRLPVITKSPSIKITDPRRQSAAAPLPTESKDPIEPTNKTKPLEDVAAIQPTTSNENTSTNNHDTPVADEQTFNASSNSSSSASASTIVSNKPDAKHIEVNKAYDSLNQPLIELNLSNEVKLKINSSSNKPQQCLQDYCFIGPNSQKTISSVPCHLMLKLVPYVASLNLHISQLLVCHYIVQL